MVAPSESSVREASEDVSRCGLGEVVPSESSVQATDLLPEAAARCGWALAFAVGDGAPFASYGDGALTARASVLVKEDVTAGLTQ